MPGGMVFQELLTNVYGKLHPGALKYYSEAGIPYRQLIAEVM